MAKNRRRKSKKKARHRQQRLPERSPVIEVPPIEDVRSRRVRRILAGAGVSPDDFHDLDLQCVLFGLSWDGLTDRLVMEHAPEAMAKAVDNYFDSSGLDLEATPSRVGIILHRGRVGRAVVYPTHVRLFGGSIRGDFTADGSHWATLRTALLEGRLPQVDRVVVTQRAEVDATTEARRAFIVFPSHVDEEFRARVLTASRKIRNERALDYGSHPVMLEADDHIVRFEAIIRRGDAVELPFAFSQRGQSTIRGALRLHSPEDPLALVCDLDLDEELLALVWGSVLLGFAELTCVAENDQLDDLVPQVVQRGRARGTASERMRSLASGGGTGHSFPTLRPTAATAAALASYVAGHRRRLSETAHASDEARAAAAEIGIVLGTHETWVRPHARGVPTGAELHFRWVSPLSLAA